MSRKNIIQPPTYSRDNPSPRYHDLGRLYIELHDQRDKGEIVYPGQSLLPHLADIKSLIDATSARSIVDYGAGQGLQYQASDLVLPGGQNIPSIKSYWGVDRIALYDPAVPEFAQRPVGTYDGVISTDVLEHCPEEDLAWIVDDLFSLAKRFVFANIASYPAKTILPNGENAHCTQRGHEWWEGLILSAASRYPDIAYSFVVQEKLDRRRFFGVFGPRIKYATHIVRTAVKIGCE